MVYANGQVPYSVVSVVLASGYDSNGYWEFRCTPAFAARWRFAKRRAEELYGRTIYIRSGWNIYRPLFSQHIARDNACEQGNCLGAAWPGTSSHGGEWQGRPCLAVDVDPNGLTWDQVDVAMEAAGFSARLITAAMSGFPGGERWHYIDFNAFGAVPAFAGATPFPVVEEEPTPKEKDMILLKGIDSGSGTTTILVVAGPGVWDRYAPSFEGVLEEQFGRAIELSKTSMLEKEALYKNAGVTAAKIDVALKDNFDALIAAVKGIPAGGGGSGASAADIATAVIDQAAARLTP
ncbi:MAG: hypothetical protein K0S49_3 [Microbacterium sp.]|jgi:hypothetical protein|nr:hypothetical protein [Microbacterium sp.]